MRKKFNERTLGEISEATGLQVRRLSAAQSEPGDHCIVSRARLQELIRKAGELDALNRAIPEGRVRLEETHLVILGEKPGAEPQ